MMRFRPHARITPDGSGALRRAGAAALATLIVTAAMAVVRLPGATSAAQPSELSPSGSDLGSVSFLVELDGPSVAELAWGEEVAPRGHIGGLLAPIVAAGGVTGLESDGLPTGVRQPPVRLTPSTLTALRGSIASRQERVAEAVAAQGGRIVGRYQVVFNGFLVHAPDAAAERLAAAEGVAGVWRMPLMTPQLAESAPHVGAPRVRRELGYDGRGVVVATIDAGVDYYHGALGGSGRLRHYDPDDENVVEPGTFPTARVVGGYDFAGQRYSPNCARLPFPLPDCHTSPSPDPDPLEPRDLSHGTAVASVLAGEETDKVAAGVAPAATLVALKVFGNPIGAPPATDLLPAALEWVVSHNLGLSVPGAAPGARIDVLNLSLGYPWSLGLPPIDAAVDAAVRSGMTVVASAGDSGGVPFVASQPGAAERALSVAAAVPPGRAETVFGILAEWLEDETPHALGAPALEASFTRQLVQTGPITTSLAWYGLACNDSSGDPVPPAQDVSGGIALVERGQCPFYDKLWNAARFGARGAIVFTDDRDVIVMSCESPSDCNSPPPIPAVMIERRPGLTLRDTLVSGATVVAAMGPELQVEKENLTDTAWDGSSRGPSRRGSLKPQITAPGLMIVAARAGGGTEGVDRSGTSIAAPFVSGAAAVLRQRSTRQGLDLGPLDVAALLMNSADAVVRIENADTGPLAAVTRQGAGRVDAWRASVGTTVVRSATGIAEIGLGVVHVSEGVTVLTPTLTVRNLSDEPRRYRVQPTFLAPGQDAGQGVTIGAPSTIEVAAGASAPLTVTVRVDAAALRPWTLRGFGTAVYEPEVQRLEVDGFLEVTPEQTGAAVPEETALVPFHVLPHAHSCIRSIPAGPLIFSAGRGEGRVQEWRNDCGADATIEAFHLVGLDAAESDGREDVSAGADIDAVGVRFAPNPNREGDHVLEFAIHTRGARRLPLEGEILVYLDLDRNGSFDRVLLNRLGRQVITLPEVANRWLVVHAPVVPGTMEPDLDNMSLDFFAQRFDLDESVATLQVSTESLGLALEAPDASFDFAVVAADNSGDFPVTPANPGRDLAPDGLLAGAAFTVDASRIGCLQLEGATGQAVLTPVAGLTLPAHGTASTTVRLTCAPDVPAGTAGFLFSYPTDAPGPGQAIVRQWLPLGPGGPLFAPSAVRNGHLGAP